MDTKGQENIKPGADEKKQDKAHEVQPGLQTSVSLGRVICNSINALIKSSRSANQSALTPLAQRLIDYWGQDPELLVGVEAEGMSVNGTLVRKMDPEAVSYTHLTLPTILLV